MILYYPIGDEHGRRLENVINIKILSQTKVVFHDGLDLLEYLQMPRREHNRENKVLVFLGGSLEQLHMLRRLNAYPGLLVDYKKILVLSDDGAIPLKEACTLYPSYITTVSSDFHDVVGVLANMSSRLSDL